MKCCMGLSLVWKCCVFGETHTAQENLILHFCFVFGPDQDELAQPAHDMVLKTTSRNQGLELSSSIMIPQTTAATDLTRGEE